MVPSNAHHAPVKLIDSLIINIGDQRLSKGKESSSPQAVMAMLILRWVHGTLSLSSYPLDDIIYLSFSCLLSTYNVSMESPRVSIK